MTRIVLERKPWRPQLPACVEIDHETIRETAAAWDAAKAALESARKDLTELEQTREAAEWRDAEAAEKARAEGKAEPKRSYVAEHDRKTDAARHELKVATLAEDRAFNALQAALDEHQVEWAEIIESDVQALDEQWAEAVNALVKLHLQRASALAIRAMVVGGDGRGVGALGFTPAQIKGIDFAQGAGKQTGHVPTGDVFAALRDLGKPEPPTPEPVQHRAPRGHGSNLLRGQGGVEDEIAERRQFAELTSVGE